VAGDVAAVVALSSQPQTTTNPLKRLGARRTMQFYDKELHEPEGPRSEAQNTKELEVARCRLWLAQAYSQMMMVGVDALVHYDINFRDLPAYLNTDLLDEGNALGLPRGAEKMLEWMRRVEHEIAASIRRKSFRKV
jgi:hypothetical protein